MPAPDEIRSGNINRIAIDVELSDAGPLRISGATNTFWSALADVDLGDVLVRPLSGPSIASAVSSSIVQNAYRSVGRIDSQTVSLSDGTRINFATAYQFDIVDLM